MKCGVNGENDSQLMGGYPQATPATLTLAYGSTLAATLIIALIAVLACVSCTAPKAESNNSETFSKNSGDGQAAANVPMQSEAVGLYAYPENPAQALKAALDSAVREHQLPLTIGAVEQISFDERQRLQIGVGFTQGSDNLCVIDFAPERLEYCLDKSLLGQLNPSFTLAFKDPDNAQDRQTVLTAVIKYLSPDLSFEEAQRLADNQGKTLGPGGYAQPVEIGGYQVQERYANQEVLLKPPDFDAKSGVSVRAIAQLWGPGPNLSLCHELTTADFDLLTSAHSQWEDKNDDPTLVYADFIVQEIYERQGGIHGETRNIIKVKSVLDGNEYTVTLDTWVFLNPYEFGTGQRYTLFVNREYLSGVSGGIFYAIQRTESSQVNLRQP